VNATAHPGPPPGMRHHHHGHADRDWMTHADCRDHDPELWFPEHQRDRALRYDTRYATKAAQHICLHCPVIADCLHYALTTDTRFGIWGGATASDRAHMTGKQTPR
jgi:WhiB family redox-sensing transcriptional regulator